MNYLLLTSALLTLVAFFVHTFVGDKEYQQIKPSSTSSQPFRFWWQHRCGWHMVSFDLLAFGGLLLYSSFYDFEGKSLLLTLVSIYFFGYAGFWLITLLVSKVSLQIYGQLGQWVLLLLIGLLTFFSR
ncbi:MAG: hypothetical protein ACFB0B_04740 [Thermonemataceae bacterium]